MPNSFKRGFTLIELMIVISVMGVLTVASTELFYRSLRSTNRSSSFIETDKNAQYVLSIVERFVRNSRKVVAIGGGVCPGSSDSITLLAEDEYEVTFSLIDGRIASNSSFLTPPEIIIEDLVFTCTRNEGRPDQITVTFDSVHTTTANDATTERTYSKTINLRNIL